MKAIRRVMLGAVYQRCRVRHVRNILVVIREG
ncbi:hypothetical protein AB0I98_48960 [Streptomyces sp. NPDC050211]